MSVKSNLATWVIAALFVSASGSPAAAEDARFSRRGSGDVRLYKHCLTEPHWGPLGASCSDLWKRVSDPSSVDIDHKAGAVAFGHKNAVLVEPYLHNDSSGTSAQTVVDKAILFRGTETGLSDVAGVAVAGDKKEVWVYDRAAQQILVFSLTNPGNVAPTKRVSVSGHVFKALRLSESGAVKGVRFDGSEESLE